MNYKMYLLLLCLPFILVACADGAAEPTTKSYYPIESNLEWEYTTFFKTEYYDTLGNIENVTIDSLSNTIARIESLNDTLSVFDNLVRMVTYDIGTPNSKHTSWYENNVAGLYLIAYKNAGASKVVIPKIISEKKYLNLNDVKKISLLLDFNLQDIASTDDSIQYFSPPRKVLAFPINVGETWTELQSPFYRERIVEDMEEKTISGVNYTVYKIGVVWRDFENIVFNDYISADYGLVLREIVADSSVITSPSGTVHGYAKLTSISKLVRRNF